MADHHATTATATTTDAKSDAAISARMWFFWAIIASFVAYAGATYVILQDVSP